MTSFDRPARFVDGPERPALTNEGHNPCSPDHYVTAWDWANARWVTFIIPCPEGCRECTKPYLEDAYQVGYQEGWDAALRWAGV